MGTTQPILPRVIPRRSVHHTLSTAVFKKGILKHVLVSQRRLLHRRRAPRGVMNRVTTLSLPAAPISMGGQPTPKVGIMPATHARVKVVLNATCHVA